MILYIKQAGYEIFHRGKILRTPVKLTIKKSDIRKYVKMMKSKSIRMYEIIEDDHDSVHSVPCKKKVNNTSIPNKIIDKKKKRINVIQKMKPVPKKEIDIDTGFHESIENVELNIDINIDSDDILKQLLLNI